MFFAAAKPVIIHKQTEKLSPVLPPRKRARADMEGNEPPLDLRYNVHTENPYDLLLLRSKETEMDTESVADSIISSRAPTSISSRRPTNKRNHSSKPTFVFPNGVAAEIRPHLTPFVGNFLLRNTAMGVKVFPKDQTTFDAMNLKLSPSTGKPLFHYYSHPGTSAKLKKFVLFGLDALTDEAVTNILIEHKLKPVLVKRMRPKECRYIGEANYLIHFAHNDDVYLKTLNLIRDLDGTLINWARYNSKQPEVTVCHNCCKFGHGSNGCHLPSVCVICSKGHSMSQCPFMIDKIRHKKDQIDVKNLRCANCKQRHTATFRECPERLKYIEDRKAASSKKSSGSSKKSSSNSKEFVASSSTFPSLPVPKTHPAGEPLSSAPVQHHQQLRAQLPPSTSTRGPSTSSSASNIHSSPQVQSATSNNNFFNNEQCQFMLFDLFDQLQACQNQYEQAKVIFSLGIKYFSKFNAP